MKEGDRKASKASGYQQNYMLWDQTGWQTEKNLHTDQKRTMYRMKYN